MITLNYAKLQPSEIETLARIKFAYSSLKGIQSAFLMAQEVLENGIEGDFVELGVASGGLACAMALAMKKHGIQRTFHLFDSYAGLPYAGPEDDCQPGIGAKTAMSDLPLRERLVSCGMNLTSVDSVRRNLGSMGASDTPLVFYKGWFQDTLPVLPESAISKIALLHLDADLYESTLISLEYMYPRVVTGGVVILDDFELGGCAKAVSKYFSGKVPELFSESDYGSVYFLKP